MVVVANIDSVLLEVPAACHQALNGRNVRGEQSGARAQERRDMPGGIDRFR